MTDLKSDGIKPIKSRYAHMTASEMRIFHSFLRGTKNRKAKTAPARMAILKPESASK